MKLLKFFLILIVLTISSCFKQEAPKIQESSVDEARLNACTNVNFDKDLLQHKSVLNLFVCAKWNKLFPNLYKSLSSIKTESWDHFIGPLDDAFFDDKSRRDRVIGYIQTLDKNNGLDDLGKVITALNETNFYDGLKEIFVCSENPGKKNCTKKKDRILTRDNIIGLFHLMNIKKKGFAELSHVVEKFSEAIEPDQEKVRSEIRKFFYEKNFINLRLFMISAFARKIATGIEEKDRIFLRSLISRRHEDSKYPWLHDWIQKEVTDEDMRYLTEYAVKTNPMVLREFRAVDKAIKTGLKCTANPGESSVTFNLEFELNNLFKKLVGEGSKKQAATMDAMANMNNAMLIAKEFCTELDVYTTEIKIPFENGYKPEEVKVRLIEITSSLHDFLSREANYKLLSFIADISTNPKFGINDPLFLIKVATEDYLYFGNEINKIIIDKSPDFYVTMLEVIKRMNPSGFVASSSFVYDFLRPENNKAFESISKAWLFFDKENQNFVFSFIDKHLKEDTDYVELFKFYAKFLFELSEVSNHFADLWIGDAKKEDFSYKSLKDIVYAFSGKETLKDFDKFFSRDHIIRIIDILTEGNQIKEEAKVQLRRLYADDYLLKIQVPPYKISFAADPEIRLKSACMDKMIHAEHGFYSLVLDIPKECKQIQNASITLTLFDWLQDIHKTYKKHLDSDEKKGSLFDKEGITSRAMLNANVAWLKVFDEILGPVDHVCNDSNCTGGVRYLLEGTRDMLYVGDSKKYRDVLIKNVDLVDGVLNQDSENQKFLRNDKLYKYLNGEYWDYTSKYLENLLTVFDSYQVWKKGPENLLENRDLGKEDPKYKCSNYLNENIGGFPCTADPSKVKVLAKKILKDLRSVYDEDGSSAAQNLITSIKKGLDRRKHEDDLQKITLKETFKMMYDLSDKTIKINRSCYEYRKDSESDYLFTNRFEDDYDRSNDTNHKPWREVDYKGKKVEPKQEPMTTMERIEVVIRDVRFDENYLGAHYMNAVAVTNDYDRTVLKKGRLMKRCVGAGFCGKFMDKDQKRMARNAVTVYDSLLEVNTYSSEIMDKEIEECIKVHKPSKEKHEFRFGGYMKALLRAVVYSSLEKSQKDSVVKMTVFGKEMVLPWVQTKKQLVRHNGKILTKLTTIGAFSNGGRLIHDRVGRTREEFNKFISSKKFNVVDQNIFQKIDYKKTNDIINNLIRKLNKYDPSIVSEGNSDEWERTFNGVNIIDHTIDWFYSLENYRNYRIVEDTVSKLLIITSFLGQPAHMFTDDAKKKEYGRYAEININSFLELFDKGLEKWPFMVKIFKANYNLMNVFKKINNGVSFFTDQLLKNDNPDTNLAYKLINDTFLLIQNVLFKKHEGRSYDDILLAYTRPETVKKVYDAIDSNSELVTFLSQEREGGSRISSIAENAKRIIHDKRINFEILRLYLEHTTRPSFCIGEANECVENNFHYDEPFQLVNYLNAANKNSGLTNLETMFENLFSPKGKSQDVLDFIDEIIPAISIERIAPQPGS